MEQASRSAELYLRALINSIWGKGAWLWHCFDTLLYLQCRCCVNLSAHLEVEVEMEVEDRRRPKRCWGRRLLFNKAFFCLFCMLIKSFARFD